MSARTKGCALPILLALLLFLLPLLWKQLVAGYYGTRIYVAAEVPVRRTAIVYGAAVFRGGRLSTVLRDRMDTAIRLYHDGVVQELLLSGDGSSDHYNEPGAMKDYALLKGVRDEDIKVDLGGHRTYDTCHRANGLFEVQEAILVTQRFHLPRALFLCERFGIDAVGAVADQREYRGARWYSVREVGATLVALADILSGREPTGMALTPATRNDVGESWR